MIFIQFKHPRVGFNLLFLADLPVGIDLGQPPKNALHSWCFFYSCPAIFEVPLYLIIDRTSDSCSLIDVICVCLRIVASNTYCVVCLSSSFVPYVASFSGLFRFDCPFGILYPLFIIPTSIKNYNIMIPSILNVHYHVSSNKSRGCTIPRKYIASPVTSRGEVNSILDDSLMNIS